jgi:hypothetical protein
MASAMELITSTTLTNSASSITFSGIPSEYGAIHFIFSSRSTSSGNTAANFGVEFNGDATTSKYASTVQTFEQVTSASTSGLRMYTNAPYTNMVGVSSGAAASSNVYSFGYLTHGGYAGTISNKTRSFITVNALMTTQQAHKNTTIIATGSFSSSNTVVSLKFIDTSASFDSGTIFSLYGLKYQ